jgi:hypothetical protein
MDEKPIVKEGEQPVIKEKVYTPPTLTVYGKLTELTAGGSRGTTEPSPGTNKNRDDPRS